MSDHGTHHHDADHSGEIKSKTAFKSSFWFVIILVGLFIAALNFINVMGHQEDHGAHGAKPGHDTHGAPGATQGDRDHDVETVTGHMEGYDTSAAVEHHEAAAPDTLGHEARH